MTEQSGRRRGVSREYLGTLGLLALGGAMGLAASGRAWGGAVVASAFTETSVPVTGNDLAPPVSAVSLVALAAVVLVPAVRGVGRRVVGPIIAVLGAAMTVAAVRTAAGLEERVRDWVMSAPEHSGPAPVTTTSAIWPWAAAVAGMLVVAAGTLVAAYGPRWPAMGTRYERPDRKAQRPASSDSRPSSAAQTWDALDRGDDPTV